MLREAPSVPFSPPSFSGSVCGGHRLSLLSFHCCPNNFSITPALPSTGLSNTAKYSRYFLKSMIYRQILSSRRPHNSLCCHLHHHFHHNFHCRRPHRHLNQNSHPLNLLLTIPFLLIRIQKNVGKGKIIYGIVSVRCPGPVMKILF